MEEHIEIIEKAIFEFEESGRASRTAMARCIVGELEKQGYKLSKLHQPTVSGSVCDKCLGRGSHVIYDTCIECKKCNGNGTQTDL